MKMLEKQEEMLNRLFYKGIQSGVKLERLKETMRVLQFRVTFREADSHALMIVCFQPESAQALQKRSLTRIMVL